MKKEKINITPINYYVLNKLAEDFGKRFVSQQELSAEQMFWLQSSNKNSEEPSTLNTPVKIEVPSDLPKVFMMKLLKFQTIFTQKEVAVEQCSVDRKYCEIQQKQFLIENDRLLDKIISQEIVNIVLNSSVIICDSEKKNEDCMDTCNKCLELEAELSMENADLKAQSQEKVFANATLKNELRKLKGKTVIDTVVSKPHATTIAPGMEHADTLQDVVKSARALSPLDSNLDSSCKYVQRIQEVLVYVRDTCPCLTRPSEKFVAVTPKNKDKKVRFADPVTSSNNTQKQVDSHKPKDYNQPLLHSTGVISSTGASGSKLVGNTKNNRISQSSSSNKTNKVEDQSRSVKSRKNKNNRVAKIKCNAYVMQSMLNVNSKSVCAICNECLFDANHDKCVLDHVHDVNVLSKFEPVKLKNKKQVWKPTSRVYTKIGYKWKLTGRTFTIVRNKCPLTRFTSTKVVLLKETTIKSVLTPTQGIKVYSRRPKATKYVGCPNCSFGNDQMAKIMGYGDYQIENVNISKVYYIEGLGHNLFSVGQFYDSDLEVAFRKHICFVCNLEGVDLLTGS
ncbi:hypothetical protein Tco_0057545 [Tanacetum coccineum]